MCRMNTSQLQVQVGAGIYFLTKLYFLIFLIFHPKKYKLNIYSKSHLKMTEIILWALIYNDIVIIIHLTTLKQVKIFK